MILAHSTWQEVEAADRECVVVIPTGSLEQHGPHLPLLTDTILVTAAAESLESRLPDQVILTPTLWLGASGHHLAFAGSCSASFEGYMSAIAEIVESLSRHRFRKFLVLNGHGGNTAPNMVVTRDIRLKHPTAIVGQVGYFDFISDYSMLEGPTKMMRHACEAEASLMMHIRPDLVRMDKLVDDGLAPEPAVVGPVFHFDEITVNGSLGYATLATASKGKRLFDQAVDGLEREVRAWFEGFVLKGSV